MDLDWLVVFDGVVYLDDERRERCGYGGLVWLELVCIIEKVLCDEF